MVNQALFDVVKNQLAIGVSEQEVREFLRRRGTSESEVQELFEALTAQSVTIRDIPVAQPAPQSIDPEPIPAMPVQSEAHGVVRDIPPLQPSAPFTPISSEQLGVAQPTSSINTPASSSVVFESETSVAPGGKRRIILWVSGLVFLLALLVGGYFVYSSYFVSPEKVMDTMISRMRDVHSGEFAIDITAVTDSMSNLASTSTDANPFLTAFAIEGPVTFTAHASGTIDLLDAQNPKIVLALTSTMDKWPMGDFALGLEYRNVSGINYLKLSNVPDLGFFSLSPLKNQWFSAADSDAKAQLGAGNSDDASPLIPTVSQDQRDRLVAAWRVNRFLAVADVLDSERIDGSSMHHYKLAFDMEAFKRFNSEVNSILDRVDTASESAQINEDLDLTTINDLEVWIGRRDGLLHKLVINVALQDKDDASKKSEVSLTMASSRFNTALDVSIPEGAKSIEEAVKAIFGQMLGGGMTEQEEVAPPVTLNDRNEQRKRDVAAIADAIKKNIATNKGVFVCDAGPLPAMATFMGAAGFGMSGYAIESCLVPAHLKEMPHDPSKGTASMSGYSVLYNAKTKKVTVRAPYTEGGTMISITK